MSEKRAKQNRRRARETTAEERYKELEQERLPFLNRGYECSKLTIPSLLPEAQVDGYSALPQPYSSDGAEGINSLKGKLIMALFPPGTTFFKLQVNKFVLDALRQRSGKNYETAKGKFDLALSEVEQSVTAQIDLKGHRPVIDEALGHLMVAGNGLLHLSKDSKLKFFPLSRYVVSRDNEDNVLDVVTKECMARASLPPHVREIVDEVDRTENGVDQDKKDVDIYTWVHLELNGTYKFHQEVRGKEIPGTSGSDPADRLSWMPLRWKRIAGESYGRGLCEEYLGDLYAANEASKAILDFGAVASRVLLFVNEAGTTSREAVESAASGDILDGNAKDITTWQMEKFADFQIVKAAGDEAKERLGRAFMKASSVQRNAERVTAEEIRAMVGELESSLGGVYALLSEELQKPLVTVLMHQMQRARALPNLGPKGTVQPQIVTGLEGLGRASDLQRLKMLIAELGAAFGPDVVARHINVGDYIRRSAAALGIDTDGLVKTDEELAQESQQANMMGMAQKLGGPAIKAISDQQLAAQQGAQPKPV